VDRPNDSKTNASSPRKIDEAGERGADDRLPVPIEADRVGTPEDDVRELLAQVPATVREIAVRRLEGVEYCCDGKLVAVSQGVCKADG
jgi:hypothetical protein